MSETNRREFLGTTAKTATMATLVSAIAPAAFAANDETLKIGLIGCGGRGSGAAGQAMRADKNSKLYAMADVFGDNLASRHKALKGGYGDQVDVPEDRRFVGLDSYKQVVDICDVVILTTPPGFRPLHLEYAVSKSKHVFCEKPIATDGPGVRRVLAACAEAKRKNISLVSGLCYRYDGPKVELMKRVHDGQIGKIQTLQTTYNGGTPWHRGKGATWSDVETQMRNWLFYAWLSGDHVVEQSIHGIDKIAWAMQDKPPLHCKSSGGRTIRTGEKYGNVYDHFNSVFEWEDGTKAFHSCRQWDGKGVYKEVSDFAFGTDGVAALQGHRISGKNAWKPARGKRINMYQFEHNELFKSIREGKPINNGAYMCNSTLLALMVRTSAYTGRTITYDQMLNSKQSLVPETLDMNGSFKHQPVAVPGKFEFA
jgi:myo-inositol 2-dehydrogenase/D-chiro-inositol 1-dehydrogenase